MFENVVRFCVCAGISVALTVRVGSYLGAGDSAAVWFFRVMVFTTMQAKRCAWTGVLMVAICEAVVIALFVGLRFEIASAFSSDSQVAECVSSLFRHDDVVCSLIASTLPIMCIFFMTDGLQASERTLSPCFFERDEQGVCGGTLRGCGVQKIGAYINISGVFFFCLGADVCIGAGYWLIGLPVGCTLAFKYSYGILGLWIGIIAASVVIGTLRTHVCECADCFSVSVPNRCVSSRLGCTSKPASVGRRSPCLPD